MMRRALASPALSFALCLGLTPVLAEPPQKLLDSAGVTGGLIVHVGGDDGQSTRALRVNERLLVHGLSTDPKVVAKARRTLLESGDYGNVSFDRFDGRQLPYVDHSVNLIVLEAAPASAPMLEEIERVLAPLGSVLIKGQGEISTGALPEGLVLDATSPASLPGWTLLHKPYPPEMGEWNHFLEGPDNNAVGRDTLAEQPRSIQWAAGPRWSRSHEELSSTSVGVTDNGRVFFIVDEAPLASIRFRGQWRLVARDAFNGMLLWKKDIPVWVDHLRHFRSGPVHLQRRLAAVDGVVYATLGLAAPVTALDAATGKVLHVYEGTEHTEEILVQDGVLYLVAGTGEVKREGGGLFKRDEPEPTPFRFAAAVDTKSGKMLWKRDFEHSDFLLPLTLTVRGRNVFCQTINGMMRLDAASGKPVWRTPRATPAKRMAFSAPTVVATDEVLLAADHETSDPAKGPVSFGVHGWNLAGINRKAPVVMNAYAVEDGKLLWSAPCSENYNAPVDIFVLGDTVFVGKKFNAHDLKTGEVLRELKWSGPAVAMAHPRCHRYKATVKNLFSGRSGIEVASFKDGWLGNNSWIRGTCQFGIMPANGLLYKAPDACGCYPKTKVQGFFAAAPRREAHWHEVSDISPGRLEKGPAFAPVKMENQRSSDPAWPAYRGDATRSGRTDAAVNASPRLQWKTRIGGRLTQAVTDGERVFLASTNAHTVHALSGTDGRALWTFTAGGRIDSAPTLHAGLVFFGSADGWVYALRSSDGALAWRFRAAPADRRVISFGHLESVWPVHGSVLIQNGHLYVAAGRSTYLDDGIALYKLAPLTGEVLSGTIVRTIDPDTNKPTVTEPSRGFDMPGSTVDLLCGDGELVYMKHLAFDADCREVEETRPHLFSPGGLLGEEWFVRNYWLFGKQVSAGWGGWARAAGPNAFGRILSFDADRIYGYGRVAISGGATGHKADSYHLYASTKLPVPPPANPEAAGNKKKGRAKPGAAKPEQFWSSDLPMAVRAMVLAPDSLVIAGPPEVGRKSQDLLAFENEEEALAAFAGENKASLVVISPQDGSTLSQAPLDAVPVFDGMSAANGNLYLALKDGSIQCWR